MPSTESNLPADAGAAAVPSTLLSFDIDSKRFIRIVVISWVAIEVLMVICDYVINYAELSDISSVQALFNITREDALPAFFGEVQNILIALVLWIIVAVVRKKGLDRFTRIGWTILAVFFSYLAIDDGSKLHERVGTIFEVANEDSGSALAAWLEYFPSYAWQLVYIPFLACMGLYVLYFLAKQLNTRAQRLMVLASLVCLTFAVGLDFIEGLDEDHPYNVYSIFVSNYNIENFTRSQFGVSGFTAMVHFSKSVEEAIEMFAMTMFLAVFLSYLFRFGPFRIDIERTVQTEPESGSGPTESTDNDPPIESASG